MRATSPSRSWTRRGIPSPRGGCIVRSRRNGPARPSRRRAVPTSRWRGSTSSTRESRTRSVSGVSPLALGAPGVYERPPTTVRALTNVRMDVCAFVGVAPRGPARVPVAGEDLTPDSSCVAPARPRRRSTAVAVESWDEYVRLYGAFEGAGLLPFAVASFFDQGGRRAYVVRVVHDFGGPDDDTGAAAGELAPLTVAGGVPVTLRARNEGSWGNGLTAELCYSTRPIVAEPLDTMRLALATDTDLTAGTVLRLQLGGGIAQVRVVASLVSEGLADRPARRIVATLAEPASAPPESVADVVSLAGPTFERCEDPAPVPGQEVPQDPLAGLALDPRLRSDRRRIVELQQRLHDLAGLLRSWIVLLDVPPGLSQRQVLEWRAQFDSGFAAAYHPWLRVAPLGDRRRDLVDLNPSATAAGIIA